MRKFLLASVISLLPFTAFAHDVHNPCDEGYEPVEYFLAWAISYSTTMSEVQDKLNNGYKLYGSLANGQYIAQPMVKCGRK